MLRKLPSRELVVDNFESVGDHVIRSCQSSKRSKNRIVNVLKQQNFIEGVRHGTDRTLSELVIYAAKLPLFCLMICICIFI